jgi:hypothetical protein
MAAPVYDEPMSRYRMRAHRRRSRRPASRPMGNSEVGHKYGGRPRGSSDHVIDKSIRDGDSSKAGRSPPQ